LFGLKLQTLLYTNKNLDEHYYTRYRCTFFGRQMLDEPLPITLSSYRVMLNGIIHWTSPNLKTWFYRKLIQRKLPKYFIFNRSQTVGYFWRNLMLYDIEKLKGTRIKKNTFTWLL
jgi:hypothetical protein